MERIIEGESTCWDDTVFTPTYRQEDPLTRLRGVAQRQPIVSTQLSHLSRPQAPRLACGSRDIVLAQRGGLTRMVVVLAARLDRIVCAVRTQRRDAAHQRGAKRGDKRRSFSLAVAPCCAPQRSRVTPLLPADCRPLALAMDASTLGQRLTLLRVSVVIRGSALPVA
ncbi:MAG: hypothetical protein MI924_00940 [Chloroflexales bacterium]|nr:hypothetical protein [Chloroflexales bacterium]